MRTVVGVFAAALCVAACVAQVGCGDPCAPGPEVKLTLHGDDAVLTHASELVVGIAVGGGTRTAHKLDFDGELRDGRALLLQPTSTPAGDAYSLTLDVSALSLDGTTLAVGGATVAASTRACNRVDISLESRPVPDFSVATAPADSGIDLATSGSMPDMTMGPDLAPCTATTPDEDGDGRGDVCDVCPADSNITITDTDSDGMPDICDPNVPVPNNYPVYFEPFNDQKVGWMGAFNVAGGQASVKTSGSGLGQLSENAAVDPMQPLPANAWLEAHGAVSAISKSFDGGVALYLWTSIYASGYRCTLEARSVGQPVMTLTILGGTTTSIGVMAEDVAVGSNFRLAIYKHGDRVGCDLLTPGRGGVTSLSQQLPAASALPLYLGAGGIVQGYSNSGSVTVQYTSLFGVSFP